MLVADPLSFAHIEDNEVSHNGRRGVTAQKAGCFLLLRNRVRHNGNIGVIGIGPWDKQHVLQIWDNDISENLAAGVWVQRGDANMLRNRVRRNRDSGVVAFGAGSCVRMEHNEIAGNRGVGISVHSAKQARTAPQTRPSQRPECAVVMAACWRRGAAS